ncbi:MAG TPA: ankyrin repeat domain-containing protein, partial [Rickettsia endosymbiont of Omalisus fontisbellaquei]|nr:ankyrin repeat domain-containing protein [Rickettsia endosymbiont of Omalisus fontisbellaquei]
TVIDGQNVSKFERLKTIKLSNSNVSNENLEKIIKYYTDQRMKITTSLNNDEVKSDVSSAQLEHMSKIINNNIDLNRQNEDGNTALHKAVVKGDIQLVKSLLDCGINETIRNKQGKKAIDLAEEKQERIGIYQLIAEYEPQVFWSALGAANGKIATQLAKTMSIEKLTMPIKDNVVRSNCEALEVALLNNGLAATALQLIKRLDINKSYGRDKDSSLHLLARNYNDTHVDIMEAMISKFPDLVTKRNNLGQTAADIAQDTKKYNFLSLLMNKNCILSKFTNDNEEIVRKAAKYGIKADKDDLKNSYNYSKCDKHKNNLLKLAVKNKDYELYEKIKAVPQYSKELENLYDNEGNHKLACNNPVNELIKIFREYGFIISEKEAITGAINLNQTNGQGNSVLYELLKTICITDNEVEKREEKVELLINAGLDVNTTNRADKWTPMHLVVSSKQSYYVEKLMSKGGKLLEDVYNRTPIEIAKRYGYIDIENSLTSIINENNAYSIEQPHHLPPYECEASLLGAGTVSLL